MSGYIWYSFGSDKTGPRLAEALGFESGKKTPNFEDYDIVIGFGCKAKDEIGQIPAVTTGDLRILNHPDKVNLNRDKVHTLERLRDAEIGTPGMVTRQERSPQDFYEAIREGLNNGVLDFPILGQSRTHNGPTFFCYTLEDVQAACLTKDSSVEYFRSFCVGTEFRIHVMRDMALCAQIKTLSENPQEQTLRALKDELTKKANKADKSINLNSDCDWVLGQLVPELLRGPSQMLRSVGRGWLLEEVDINQIPGPVVTEAINALEAVDLDMGAVSITFDEAVARVTNITTAPAINNSEMGCYVGAIQEFMETGPKVRNKPAAKKVETASPELIARFTRKLREVEAGKLEKLLKLLE